MTESKSHLLLEHYWKQLKLPTILREYATVAARCTKDRCDYVGFLLRLVEREALDRDQRAAARRVKNARFPVIKTLDTFDFSVQPSIHEKLVRELMVGEYMDRHENVLIVGNSGTGKTPLASALGFAGCRQGRRVRFFTVKALVTLLMEMTEQRQLERTLRHLERQNLLILDELGYVPFSQTGAELLFVVIRRAYERLSLIVTTNLPFESLDGGLGLGATHRSLAGSLDPSGAHPRSQRSQLPASGIQTPAPTKRLQTLRNQSRGPGVGRGLGQMNRKPLTPRIVRGT